LESQPQKLLHFLQIKSWWRWKNSWSWGLAILWSCPYSMCRKELIDRIRNLEDDLHEIKYDKYKKKWVYIRIDLDSSHCQ
jgi:hypothetical protein